MQASTEGFRNVPVPGDGERTYIRFPYSPENEKKQLQKEEQRERERQLKYPDEVTPDLIPKSTSKTYLFFFLGGWYGLHRYYLGHKRRADIMLKRGLIISYAFLMGYLLEAAPMASIAVKVIAVLIAIVYVCCNVLMDFLVLPFAVGYHNRRVRRTLRQQGRKQRFRYGKLPYDCDFVVSKSQKRWYGITEDQVYSSRELWKYF